MTARSHGRCAWPTTVLAGAGLLSAMVSAAAGASDSEGVRDSLSREIETDLEAARTAAESKSGEALHFRWDLGGFLGSLAGLFLPNHGDALLTFVSSDVDRMVVQILITAPKREGEYFLYGAEIDESRGDTTAVWSSYVFRDRLREKEQEIDDAGVIDFASAIHHLREKPPEQTTEMSIWDNGKLHPVEVDPLGLVRRKLQGKKVHLRGYAIRGVKVNGKRSFNERYFLYFSADETATLAQIVGKRGLVQLQLSRVGAE